MDFGIGDAVWSTLRVLVASGPSHAFAGEFDAVSIVNEAVQDRVRVCGIADDFVPTVHGEL